MACKNGIKRTHLVDARIDGGMLLELYSRDGVGTMISADFYEGIRPARSTDLEAIQVDTLSGCHAPQEIHYTGPAKGNVADRQGSSGART